MFIQIQILSDKQCRSRSVGFYQLASQRPTDLDLHCLQRQGISGFSRTRVKGLNKLCRCFAMFHKGNHFCDFLFAFLPNPLEKGSALKINRKEFAPSFKLALQKHAYSNILKILQSKKENFQINNSDIFHISAQNIDYGYALELTR